MPPAESRLRHTGAVSARSAVFDLYGDHLSGHDHWAPIAAVVALLQAGGVQPAATRTAVSRMADQGWLQAQRRGGVRGYRATASAQERLAAAHRRIYRREAEPWDGAWHLLVVDHRRDRALRDRVVATLGYLGYGRLGTGTWVAPRRGTEVIGALGALGVSVYEFTAAQPVAPAADAARLAAQVWDLDTLAAAYEQFRADTAPVLQQARAGLGPARAYPVRTALVHRWRKFLFVDPDLPREVLPPTWPGAPARADFLEAADLLAPAARIFVSDALAAAGASSTGGQR